MLSPLRYSWSPSKQLFLDVKTSFSVDVMAVGFEVSDIDEMGVMEVTGQIGLFVVTGIRVGGTVSVFAVFRSVLSLEFGVADIRDAVVIVDLRALVVLAVVVGLAALSVTLAVDEVVVVTGFDVTAD